MKAQLRRIAATGVVALEEEVKNQEWGRRLHSLIWLCIFFFLGTIPVAWGLNVMDYPRANVVFAFVGVLFILLKLSLPFFIGAGGFLGFTAAAMKGQDKSQGIVGGVATIFQMAMWVSFIYTSIMGILSFWSFKEDPAAFWVMALAATIIFTGIFAYKKGGSIFFYVMVTISIGTILWALWGTLSEKQRSTLTRSEGGEMAPEIAFFGPGETKVVILHKDGRIHWSIPKKGVSFTICAEVAERMDNLPKRQLEFEAVPEGLDPLRMTAKLKRYLTQSGRNTVAVKVTSLGVASDRHNLCLHTD